MNSISFSKRWVFFACFFPICAAFLTTAAYSYTESTLYKFCAEKKCADGKSPVELVADSSGNFYGTTIYGPRHGNKFGYGSVFELTPSTGNFQLLYQFCSQAGCSDGANPYRVKLVIDTSGNLYGTTQHGGSNGEFGGGVVFELVRNGSTWQEKVLHTFCSKENCEDGAVPYAGLTYSGAASGALYDGVSPLYGTTQQGGKSGKGTVFSLQSGNDGWTEKVLYSFCKRSKCADGEEPYTPLYLDNAGNLFGTTSNGGKKFLGGTVFELSPTGKDFYYKVLYSFCSQKNCADGEEPFSGVVADPAGDLFGTAAGGNKNGDGILYELIPQDDGTWKYDVLADFEGKNGRDPVSLILSNNGDLLGTTYKGGTRDKGTVFQYSNGSLQTIYNVCQAHKCPEGAHPLGGIVQDTQGNLFGTNVVGGMHNGGTLYKLVNDKPTHRAK